MKQITILIVISQTMGLIESRIWKQAARKDYESPGGDIFSKRAVREEAVIMGMEIKPTSPHRLVTKLKKEN